MITRPPSNQHNRDDYWTRDPAFMQGPTHPDDKASPEALAAYAKGKEEHERKWRVARETGNYAELLIQGAQPTKFIMRPIAGELVRKLIDASLAGKIGNLELNALAFRAAIVDVVNFGDVKVQMITSDLGPIADVAIANELDACAKGCVNELGGEAFSRAVGLSGK